MLLNATNNAMTIAEAHEKIITLWLRKKCGTINFGLISLLRAGRVLKTDGAATECRSVL